MKLEHAYGIQVFDHAALPADLRRRRSGSYTVFLPLKHAHITLAVGRMWDIAHRLGRDLEQIDVEDGVAVIVTRPHHAMVDAIEDHLGVDKW